MARRKIKLSASAIGELKACPYRYYAKYILGIRKEEDSEAQRIGTNWHEIQDVANRSGVCVPCANLLAPDPECPMCAGTGFLPDEHTRHSRQVWIRRKQTSNGRSCSTP